MTRGRQTALIIATTIVACVVIYALGKRPHDPLTRLRFDGTAYRGSWWFPRGGPYVLGFDSPGQAAELAIDGQTVASGAGISSNRVVFQAGIHAVSFSGPGVNHAHLLWHPPGRRGALEYVSPSSLSPEDPASATFHDPGTSRWHGAVGFLILIVLGLGALALVRPLADTRASTVGAALFALALAVRLYGMSAAGQTWDEDEYWSSGRNYAINGLTGDFKDHDWMSNFQHPPVTKYLAGPGALWDDGYGASRFVFVLLGAVTCVLAYGAGRRMFGERAGVLAGIGCALMPHLIAHARIVGHETPSVFFWTAGVWLALRVHDPQRPTGPAATTRDTALRLAGLGVVLGLAIGTRFTNLLLAPLIGVVALVGAPRGQARKIIVLGLALTPVVAVLTFVAIWPRMWSQPITHLQDAYQVLRQTHLPEPYLGQLTATPGWPYFLVAIYATTPLVVLLLAVAGVVRALVRREKAWLIMLAWLAAPLGILFSPVRQDGVRYVLPIFVALAIAAGAGLDFAIARAPRWAGVLAGALLATYLCLTCARIQPYYLDYYAEQVGGPASVKARNMLQTGWWGEGIASGVTYINAHADRGAAVARLVIPSHVTWFRGDLWDHLTDRVTPQTDWILLNDSWADTRSPGFRPPAEFTLVHEVSAQGASLVRVYQRRIEAIPGTPSSNPPPPRVH